MKRVAWAPSAFACAGMALVAAAYELWLRGAFAAAHEHTFDLVASEIAVNLCFVAIGALLIGIVAGPLGFVASWAFWRLTRHRLAILGQGALLAWVFLTPARELHEVQGAEWTALAFALGLLIAYGLARADFLLTAEWGLGMRAGSALVLVTVAASLGAFVKARDARLHLASFEGTFSGRALRAFLEAPATRKLDPLAGTGAGLGPLVQGNDKLAQRPSILLVTVEGLRADRVRPGGSTREVMSNVEKLIAQGFFMSRAYTITPTCAPSLATILSGAPPHEHGVWHDAQRPNVSTLFDALRSSYDTAAFFVDGSATKNLTEGAGLVEAIVSASPGELIDWITAPRARPAFAWIHVGSRSIERPTKELDTFKSAAERVPPLAAPNAWIEAGGRSDRARFRDVYDANLRRSDLVIGAIEQALERSNGWARTVMIVASDHGMAFGEHERFGHGHSVFEEEIRVPIVFSGSGIAGYPKAEAPTGRRSDLLVSTMDIAPTVLELAGLGPSTATRGRSLAPVLRGGAVAPYPWVGAFVPARDGPPIAAAIVTEREKLIARGTITLLFALKRDPKEWHSVLGLRPSRDDRLKRELEAWTGARWSGAETGRTDVRFLSTR
ncbi:MAG: sulfatase-like hydrolase/transferase [Deltaproteobacteria bacterium]|nr:sulfatase-like hydrolase/transferase [Deltaproteobacteria bacterium]